MKNLFSYKFFSFFILSLALVLDSGHLYAQQPNIIYIYDDLGRLARVVNQNNECATYEYDAVGNILSITRSTNCLQPATVDSLSQDTANAGDTACITIKGTNFLGATVTTESPDIRVSRVRATETSIEVCLIISPFAMLGTSNIIVTTAAGTVVRPFTINPRIVVITQNTAIEETDLRFDRTILTIEGAVTVTMNGSHQFASLSLRNGARLTHSPATATKINKLDLKVATSLTIDSTSRIDVTARGFLGALGPGNPFVRDGMTVGFIRGSTGRSGGSYGGLGGASDGGAPNPVYGDFRDPNEPGSGGGSLGGRGGDGGGLVRIVAQTVHLDGSIVANGRGDDLDVGGGSGGGIRIDVETLQGIGQITANGGNGSRSSGAGGGRVAIYYQNAVGFDLSKVTAFGGVGTGGHPSAGAGTVYLQGPGRETGELIVDNNNLISITQSTPIPSSLSNLLALTNLRVRRAAKVRVDDQLNLASTLEISSAGEFIPVKAVIAPTVTLSNGGLVTQLSTTGSALFKVDLSATTLTIDGSSRIDVTNRGFLGASAPGNPSNRDGMTLGFTKGSTGRSGGSYGGLGGASDGGSPNPIYGDSGNPNEPGSGGGSLGGRGGNGGGLIRITAQALQLDGSVVANGGDGEFDAGAGSGGGIRIDVGTLQGIGQVTANGGNGSRSSGGGGGRVAIYYKNLAGFDFGRVTVTGGIGTGGHPNGQNGTVIPQ